MYYIEEYDGLTIFETKEIKLKSPSYLMLGLPDTGLVASISASYMVDALKMEEVGGIDSYRYFPPITVIHNGEPKPPLRIFHKDNMLVMISEIPISPAAIHPIAFLIVDYARKKGIDHIVSPVGIGVPNRVSIEKPTVYWTSTSKEGEEIMEKLGIKKFQEGFIVGPYAIILKEAKRIVGDCMCLCGNIPCQSLEKITLSEVNKLVRKAIKDAAPGGGFILTTTGPVIWSLDQPHGIIINNLIQMIRCGRIYGRLHP